MDNATPLGELGFSELNKINFRVFNDFTAREE
jgi:hypothetical protein